MTAAIDRSAAERRGQSLAQFHRNRGVESLGTK